MLAEHKSRSIPGWHSARDVLASVLRYILETSRAEPAALRELLARQVGREAAEEIMTTAEMLRREGKAEGKAEGKVEGEVTGKRGALLLLLRQRFGRLPAAATACVDGAGTADLDVWFSRVLTASSLDEVLGTKVTAARSKAVSPAPTPTRRARQRPSG